MRWSFAAGAPVRSSPIIGQAERIYFGADDGRLRSLSAAGELRWQLATGGAIRSTPAVARDGTVYFGSDDGNLYAASDTGKLVFKYASRQRRRVRSSPAIGPHGAVVFGADDGFIRSVAPDGTLVWEVRTGGPVRSSPVVAQSGLSIVGSDDGSVYAIDLEGKIRWSAQTNGPVRSSAALARRSVFIGSDDGFLYGLRLTDGAPLWRTSIGAAAGGCSPSLGADDVVVICAESGGVSAVDASTGVLRWQRDVGGIRSWAPAVDGVGSAIVTTAGKLQAIDSAGLATWSVALASGATGSPAIGLDGTVYAGTEDGRLVAIGRPFASTKDRCFASLGEACPCLCTACPDTAAACASEPACAAIFDCALTTGCRGNECLAQPSCARIIEQSGGMFSSSMRLAGIVGDCAIRECGACR